MVSTYDDGRAKLTLANHVIEAAAQFGALAISQPADAGRQTLELHFLSSQANPPSQVLVVGKSVNNRLVRSIDVFGITGQSGPAEWPASLTEERSNVLRHESGNSKRIGDPSLDRLGANIVAVLKRHGPAILKLQERADMKGDRFL